MKPSKVSLIIPFLILCMLPGLVHALDLFEDKDVIWQEGPNVYIKLAQQEGREYGPNDHPAQLKVDAVKHVLRAMRFENESARAVFTEEQAETLGSMLSEGLRQAKPDQDVLFALMRSEKSKLLGLRPDRYFVAGRAFFKLGQLHIIFGDYDRWRNDSAEKAYDPTEVGITKYKLEHGRRLKSSGKVKYPVQNVDGLKNMRYKGQMRNDWLVIDVDRASNAYAQVIENKKQSELDAKRQELRKMLREEMGVARQPAPRRVVRTPEERLEALNRLQEKGLITDQEYAKKRQQILDDL